MLELLAQGRLTEMIWGGSGVVITLAGLAIKQGISVRIGKDKDKGKGNGNGKDEYVKKETCGAIHTGLEKLLNERKEAVDETKRQVANLHEEVTDGFQRFDGKLDVIAARLSKP